MGRVGKWQSPPLGGTEETCGCGTQGHGLAMDLVVSMVGLDDLAFSNLNDLMILYEDHGVTSLEGPPGGLQPNS